MKANGELSAYFIQCAVMNGSAMLRPVPKGSATEIAILEFAENNGYDYEAEKQRYKIIAKFPFSSKRKRMSTLIQFENGQRRLVTKGGSEIILDVCNSLYSPNDSLVVPLTSDLRAFITQNIQEMGGNALRTMSLAYKNIPQEEDIIT